MNRLRCLLFVAALCTFMGPGQAGAGEADDLQRMIDVGRQGVNDLDRLDALKAAREEIALLRVWLDSAWRFRSEQKYDEVRVVLDRCQAQAEMIRQRISASKVSAEAAEKETELAKVKEKIAKTKQALQKANLEKAALGSKSK